METLDQAELEKTFGERLVTLNNGRQGLLRTATLEAQRQAKAADGRAIYYFRASDATRDRYDEVIEPSGWDVKSFKANPVIVDCHNYSSVAFVIGTAPVVELGADALVLGVTYSQANPLGRLAEAMVAEKSICTGSVGFLPIEGQRGAKPEDPRYRFTKQELLEFSNTVVPANPNALALMLKSGSVQTQELRDLADFLKPFCNEEASPRTYPAARRPGTDGAELLRLARALSTTLKRA